MTFIIADSGSTKVDWRIVADGSIVQVITKGINPVYISEEEIRNILMEHLFPITGAEVVKIFFYGAGLVSRESVSRLENCFKTVFSNPDCVFESDIKASALALFGRGRGMACILGTGANSCLCDNAEILYNVRPGGFIIGDEGSGAFIGKRLLSDFVKGLLPEEIAEDLSRRYDLDYASVVENVYRKPSANRYLSSFCPFVAEYAAHEYMDRMLQDCFLEFFDRNVEVYRIKGWMDASCEIGFTGSVAYYFAAALKKAAEVKGYKIKRILRSPADRLVDFYVKEFGYAK